MIGETLSHYRIEARLGSGGGGVVYRAHDERLHRTVAIKVIGPDTQPEPADRAALLREARAASDLNHPNICAVFEVGEADGRAFIVMEYVEGQALAQLIPSSGLPTEAVVRYGIQVADALDHAHQRGVIHRDLKTANIVVGAQGRAKVLDFGLARRVDQADAELVTRSVPAAESGAVTGTLAYMAPEMLSGQPADTRSDIWALGVVLYEMATGALPFTGPSAFGLIAAILRGPVPPLPAHVPPILRGIILHCLAREPVQRYQHAGEARAALEAMQSDVIAVPPVRTSSRRRNLTLLGIAAVVGAVAVWMMTRDTRSVWELIAADGQLRSLVSSDARTFYPTLSPDGRMLAYVAESHGQRDLYVRRVAGGPDLRLTSDSAIEESPHFSPDGERIVFTRAAEDSGPEIRIVPALGGTAVTVVREAAYPAWSPDGTRLAYVHRRKDGTALDLMISGIDGSTPRVVLPGDSSYPFLSDPAWSPDERETAVVRSSGGAAAEIWRVPLDGRAPVRALNEPVSIFSQGPVYSYDGEGIVCSSNRGGATNIWFLPLDGGAPTRLTGGPGPDESPSVATDDSIAFVNSRWRYTIERHDLRTGAVRALASHAYFLWGPAVSPDGREMAFSRAETDGAWHIWTVPIEGGTPRQLTNGEAGELYPRYAPDGRSILFYTWSTPRRIGRAPRQGGPLNFLRFDGETIGVLADPSPDGKFIAFARPVGDAERIYVASPQGGTSRLLTDSPGTVPRWSPDGGRLAFARDRSYRGGISIIQADGTSEHQVSPTGGWPVWWPDGRRLGFLVVGAQGNQQIEVVDLGDRSMQLLDQIRLVGVNHPFAVLPDGQSILVSNSQHLADEIWLLKPPH